MKWSHSEMAIRYLSEIVQRKCITSLSTTTTMATSTTTALYEWRTNGRRRQEEGAKRKKKCQPNKIRTSPNWIGLCIRLIESFRMYHSPRECLFYVMHCIAFSLWRICRTFSMPMHTHTHTQLTYKYNLLHGFYICSDVRKTLRTMYIKAEKKK